MVEWSITVVLKTTVPRGTGGSNPSLSAVSLEYQVFTEFTPNFTPKNVKLGVLFFHSYNVDNRRKILLFSMFI